MAARIVHARIDDVLHPRGSSSVRDGVGELDLVLRAGEHEEQAVGLVLEQLVRVGGVSLDDGDTWVFGKLLSLGRGRVARHGLDVGNATVKVLLSVAGGEARSGVVWRCHDLRSGPTLMTAAPWWPVEPRTMTDLRADMLYDQVRAQE